MQLQTFLSTTLILLACTASRAIAVPLGAQLQAESQASLTLLTPKPESLKPNWVPAQLMTKREAELDMGLATEKRGLNAEFEHLSKRQTITLAILLAPLVNLLQPLHGKLTALKELLQTGKAPTNLITVMQEQIDKLSALLALLQDSSQVVTRDAHRVTLEKRLLSHIFDLLRELQATSVTTLDALQGLLPEIRALASASAPTAVALLEQIIASVGPLAALLS